MKGTKVEDFNFYQRQAHETSTYGHKTQVEDLKSALVELIAEVGELAEPIQQAARANAERIEKVEYIQKELGDVLWALAEIATLCGINLGLVATQNLDKLARRKAEGKILKMHRE